MGNGRSGEAGTIYIRTVIYVNINLLSLYVAAGVVEVARVVGTSDTTAIVFWTPPSQPNGVITGYQIIYSVYGDSINSMNQAVTSNEDSFVITNLSK